MWRGNVAKAIRDKRDVLSDNDVKEQLSYAYLHAIASRARFGCDRPSADRDSVDASISARGSLAADSLLRSPKLDFQLKATAMPVLVNDRFAFELKLKNYDDLRDDSRHVPLLLAVFVMPEEEAQWLTHTEEALMTRRCMYWCNLKGFAASANTATQTVSVSRHNMLTPGSLRQLLMRVSRQEEIGNVL